MLRVAARTVAGSPRAIRVLDDTPLCEAAASCVQIDEFVTLNEQTCVYEHQQTAALRDHQWTCGVGRICNMVALLWRTHEPRARWGYWTQRPAAIGLTGRCEQPPLVLLDIATSRRNVLPDHGWSDRATDPGQVGLYLVVWPPKRLLGPFPHSTSFTVAASWPMVARLATRS